jgi:MerR family transcriptional regulator, copper efflux regulator
MNIGQAAAASGISARMIRHYEALGLIPPPGRRSSGYRDYGLPEVARLGFIAKARALGFAIEDIRQLLSLWDDRARSNAEVKALALAQAEALGAKVAAMEAMRATLLDLADRCRGDARADCPILAELAGREAA